MADPTPVAMRLAEASVPQVTITASASNEEINDLMAEAGRRRRMEVQRVAISNDDAGVREAVEKLEWVVRDSYYKAPEQLDPLHKAWLGKVESALSTLTGTQEVSDD